MGTGVTEITTMFGLAMLSVSLWTYRVSITARGLKLASASMAAVEAVVYVLSFSELITDLGSPGRIMGYAAGVAVGTAIGLVVDERSVRGHTELHLVARGERDDLRQQLHARGWPVTTSTATGPDGAVTAMWVTVSDTHVREISEQVECLAPDAFWTLRPLQKVTGSAPVNAGSPRTTARARVRRSRPGHASPSVPSPRRRRRRRPRPAPARS